MSPAIPALARRARRAATRALYSARKGPVATAARTVLVAFGGGKAPNVARPKPLALEERAMLLRELRAVQAALWTQHAPLRRGARSITVEKQDQAIANLRVALQPMARCA